MSTSKNSSSGERMLEILEKAIDTQLDTFIVFDPATGKAIRWNKAFSKISGYSDKEIASMSAPKSYYSDEDLARAAPFIEKVLQSGEGKIELNLICKDGRSIPFEYAVGVIKDDHDNPLYFISVGRDISERKLAEKEIKGHISFLDDTMAQSPYSMWISDIHGNIIKTNIALRKTLNLTDQQIIGSYNALHDDNLNQQGVMPLVERVFNELQPCRFTIPWSGSRTGDAAFHDASDLWIDVSVFPIVDDVGKLKNVVCQWIDITDRKRAEDELKRHRDNLEELVKERTLEVEEKNKELERNMKVFVGRELTIRNLQNRVSELKMKLKKDS